MKKYSSEMVSYFSSFCPSFLLFNSRTSGLMITKSSIRFSPTFSSTYSEELYPERMVLLRDLKCYLFLKTISAGTNSFDLVYFLAVLPKGLFKRIMCELTRSLFAS